MTNKISYIIFSLSSAIVLFYGVWITTPHLDDLIIEVLSWGFLCFCALFGWTKLIDKEEWK